MSAEPRRGFKQWRYPQGPGDAMDEAIARFAEAYADQTERDFAALGAAAKQKRIEVARAA